jgi:uncharacterized membrane protein
VDYGSVEIGLAAGASYVMDLPGKLVNHRKVMAIAWIVGAFLGVRSREGLRALRGCIGYNSSLKCIQRSGSLFAQGDHDSARL